MLVIELARELVRRHTVSDVSTREIADFVSGTLEPHGFKISQHPYRDGKGIEKVNVVATKGDGKPRLALTGHLDTVPYNESEWVSNPLELIERQGKYYGMGICDMKGFLALAMCAGMQIPATDLRHPFALVFTSDEEVGCIGAKRLVKEVGQIAEMILIGEPTEMRPVYMHKGYIFLRITLQGQRGHSSDPASGKNVVERALPVVIQQLMEFRQAMECFHDHRLSPPYPTLNIGKVDTGAGSAKNVIADHCVVELEVRFILGQDSADLIQAIQGFVAPDGEINEIKVKILPARAPTPPFATPPDSLIVRQAVKMTGRQPISVPFNTEGGVFNSAGSQSVVCGLGNILQAHKPNEFLDALYLRDEVVQQYADLIRKICGKDAE